MRICLVSEYYYPVLGGITEHVYQFSRQCLNRGHEVTLLTSHAGDIDPTLIPSRLKIRRMGRSVKIFSNGSIARVTLSTSIGREVRSFLKSESFDIVHVHAALTPVLPLLAVRYRTSPTVGTIHTDFQQNRFYEMFQRQCQEILNHHDGIVAISPICVESMQRYFDINATVIPNGVDVDWFANGRLLPEMKDGTFTILFLGRFDPRNGLDTLINAYAMLRAQGIKARLVIAGDGPLRPHYEKLVPADLRGDVRFIGAINRERPDVFASSDVFCYPARKGSFGITLLEAMAAGLPVVASNIRGFADLLRHGKDGLLFDQDNPQTLCDVLTRLAQDVDLRRRFAACGRQRAAEFSWGKVSQSILAYYEQILSVQNRRLHA